MLMLSVMAERTRGKEGQRRGIVVLWVGHGANDADQTDSLSNARQLFFLFDVFPIRFRGVHGCHDDGRLTQLWNRMVAVIEPQQAVRFQSHFGSLSACLQSLRRYGIPQEILPLDAQGNLDVSDFREILTRYESQMDDGGDNHQGVEFPARTVPIRCPTENDILLGKGKRSDKFRGNHLFRKAIAENYDAYNSSSDRRGKLATLQLIYFRLLQSGCRFLAPFQRDGSGGDPHEWMMLAEEDALAKISMGIRNFRRRGSSSGRPCQLTVGLDRDQK